MEGLVNYSSEDDQDEQSSDHVAERGTSAKRASYRGRAEDSPPAPTSSDNKSNTNSQRGANTSTAASSHQRKRRSSSHGRERERGSHTRDEDANPHQRHSKHSNGNGNGNRFGSSSSSSARHREESSTCKEHKETKGSREHRDSPRKGDRNRSKDHKNEHRDQRRRDNERDHHSGRGNKSTSSSSSSAAKGRYNDERHERPKDFSHSKQYQQHRERKDRHERQTRRERSAERYSRRDKAAPTRSRSRSHSSHSRSKSPPARAHTTRTDKQQSRKRHSPPRSRSQTPVRSRSGSREMAAKPIEKARLTALEMEKKIKMPATESCGEGAGSAASDAAHSTPVPVRPIVPLMSLPLCDTAPKLPNLIAITSGGGGVGPATRHTHEPSVIQLPSYYNPSAINPTKYAEQVQKRKLIWGAKKAEDTAAKWGNAQFSEDSDGKVASKFMRLMGIKGAVAAKPPEAAAAPVSAAPDVKSREAMFSNMEQQYEVARQTTHTMRGVGLGFSSQARPF